MIVNTGEGGTFQSGLDVAELAHDREALREQSRRTRDAELRLTAWHNRVDKPVIAAINGTCAGGGLHFVADADVVLASSDASFLDPHVSLGQVSAFEVIALARKIPAEAVFRMALLGSHERLPVARAHQLGLVSEIVDPPGISARRTRAGRDDRPELPCRDGGDEACDVADLELGLTDACKAGAGDIVSVWGHPDQDEGPLAFSERRDPVWVAPVAAA